MKRKRDNGGRDGKENMHPNSSHGQIANRVNIDMNIDQNQDVSTASVPLRSIFTRVFHEIESSPSSIQSPVHQTINTPENTTPKPVCLFGKTCQINFL